MNDSDDLPERPAVVLETQDLSASFGELLGCRMCGGKGYAYDMRGTDTHEICTVECGDCDHEVQAATPEAAAAKWHAQRA